MLKKELDRIAAKGSFRGRLESATTPSALEAIVSELANVNRLAALESQFVSLRAANAAKDEPPSSAREPQQINEPRNRESLENAAIACLFSIGPNAAEIARKVGVHRTTLRDWPKFKLAYELAKKNAADEKTTFRRGSKSSEGVMEAWSNGSDGD